MSDVEAAEKQEERRSFQHAPMRARELSRVVAGVQKSQIVGGALVQADGAGHEEDRERGLVMATEE